VEKLLPHGKAKAENVAEAFALSLRTLARRLADEGTTYGEVVDQLRSSLATQYLKDPGCRSGRLRGCSATRDRPRSIMLSSAGLDGRLPLIGTGERGRALLA
jgi:AraC-like DNA-binding protein